ncbi:metallophosphoesterase [Clostridium estertheticum]|uniref:metallophosphoesterase n=1 Tax=Clostridium estertheticum TaxID=238834 RepID=UPI001C0D7942|nr:metallophosphoesterase [Clostridium estertheticum]MBU3171324.1 metallophosphoesterase [Clostridium estertheticum]
MKIVMVSDLHICDNTELYIKKLYHIIDKMYEIINRETYFMEQIVILMCGDVSNHGDKTLYESAKKIYKYIHNKAGNRFIEFVMIPGNHDVCDESFADFDGFCKQFQNDSCRFVDYNCYSKNMANMNFILANSAYHLANSAYDKKLDYGNVDVDQIISNVHSYLVNVLVTHHSTISEDDNDSASIHNIPRLLHAINQNNIMYHLHGHTHGTYSLRIGNRCQSIGVGALFLAAPEMGSQFNLITIADGEIVEVCNYLYRIDSDRFIPDPIKLGDEEKEILYVNLPNEFKKYEKPENYIQRVVAPYDIVQQGGISMLYSKEQIKRLEEICVEKSRIVLLGEAGVGKSFELKNLAFVLQNQCEAMPLYIQLTSYVDETIDDLITEQYKDIELGKVALIFDGYDEIEAKNLNTFARRLNVFAKKHSEQIIVVSTRNNFYKNALDKISVGTFNDFEEYALCPIEEKNIKEFLEKKEIDSVLFFDEVKSKKLKEQILNPFFLIQLADLYLKEGYLPNQDETMEKLIYSRFEEDEIKYTVTIDVEGEKSNIVNSLEQLAFAMQCLKKTFLIKEEYQLLLNSEERNRIRYSGIWCKINANKWQFEHNNFREYLSAKYLCKKTLDEIIDLVTYKDNKKEIKTSWVNTLSFLMLIYGDKELTQWLIDTAPSIVVRFEISRIDVTIRANILCSILEDYKNKNMWISWNQNDEKELALFGQAERSIGYLMNEIGKPANFRSQSNALHIIGAMTDFLGRKEEVRRCLLDCCFSKDTRCYEVKAAIVALANPELYQKEDIHILLDKFSEEYNTEIRYALYCYILEHNLQNKSIDYVLQGIDILNVRGTQNFSDSYRLKDILMLLNEYDSIHKTFEFLITNKDYYETMEYFKDVINTLCIEAEKIYFAGKKKILNDIRAVFIKACSQFEHISMNETKAFLKNSNNIYSTYEYILENLKDDNSIFLIEAIMDESCIDDFMERYQEDRISDKSLFNQYVQRLRKGSYRYDELRELLLKKDNIVIEEKEVINYDLLRKVGEQKYFNALFSRDKYQNLINELANISNGLNTVYGDLDHISFQRTKKRFDLDKVHWDIARNKFANNRIVDFLKNVDWEEFSIRNIYRALENKHEFIISEIQEDFIREYSLKAVNEIDFDKEFTFSKGGTTSFSWTAVMCMFFAKYFSIEYDHQIVLNMLMVPAFVFGKEKNGREQFSNYVIERLKPVEIQEQVCINIKEKTIEGSLAETYLQYCKENNLECAFSLALNIITDEEYLEWTRRVALDYLCVIGGEEYILENIMTKANTVLLNLIVDKLIARKDERLIERLIKENQLSEDGVSYLKSLILMESEYGLEKYYDIAKIKNSIPDLTDDNNIAPLTEAISEIKEVRNLDCIIKLCELYFSKGFKDNQFSGLYNSVYKALKNICQSGAIIVMEKLEKAKDENSDNEEFKSFCNQNLAEIKTQYYNQQDDPWKIGDIKKYMLI